jgi:hypothetical protein
MDKKTIALVFTTAAIILVSLFYTFYATFISQDFYIVGHEDTPKTE